MAQKKFGVFDQSKDNLPLRKERVKKDKKRKRAVLQYPKVGIQMKYPIMKGKSVNKHPEVKHKLHIAKEEQNVSGERQHETTNSKSSLTTPFGTLLRLGVHVLRSRSLCFAGRKVLGVAIPTNPSLQVLIIERVVRWYSLCIESWKNKYFLDQKCFDRREKQFLSLLSQKGLL